MMERSYERVPSNDKKEADERFGRSYKNGKYWKKWVARRKSRDQNYNGWNGRIHWCRCAQELDGKLHVATVKQF